MDTRFWGPSGWKLLHLIAAEYQYSAESALSFANFFETIPYILPCKFCRASLTDYYRQHPYQLDHGMNPTLDVKKWMYTIHNCVNAKLRSQGLHAERDPTYAQVKKIYEQKRTWDQQLLPLWDFFFSVAYHHPKQSAFHSKPMPDCPKKVGTDPCEQNKWNVLPWKQRMHWYGRFWTFLPAVLPHELGKRWKMVEEQHPPAMGSRRSMLAWLWRMRCGLDTEFHDPYTSVCRRIKTYSSECGGITCRKRSTRSNRQTQRKRSTRSTRQKTLRKTK